jgi:hypothetical protein
VTLFGISFRPIFGPVFGPFWALRHPPTGAPRPPPTRPVDASGPVRPQRPVDASGPANANPAPIIRNRLTASQAPRSRRSHQPQPQPHPSVGPGPVGANSKREM